MTRPNRRARLGLVSCFALASGSWLACDPAPAPEPASAPEARAGALGGGPREGAAPAPSATTAAPGGTTPAASASHATSTPTTVVPSPTTPEPVAGWEVARGPDGQPLSLEARRETARAQAAEALAARRELTRLAGSDRPEDRAALRAIIVGPGRAELRVAGIAELGDHRRDDLVPVLRKLLDDQAVNVRAEAAVRLWRWGERELALPRLKELAQDGELVSRAFVADLQGARPVFGAGAADFFRHALASGTAMVRVDAAVGLISLGEPTEASRVMALVLATSEHPDERLFATSRLAALRDLPAARALLEVAAKDSDPTIAATAHAALAQETSP